MNDADLKRLEQRIETGLAGESGAGVREAVMLALEYHLQERELPGALGPDQTLEARAYNNGRAAMLLDFEKFLVELSERRAVVLPRRKRRSK